MSDFDTLLERLLFDSQFKASLAADPDRALAGYQLADDERAVLMAEVTTDPGSQSQVEVRTSKASAFGLLSVASEMLAGGAGLGSSSHEDTWNAPPAEVNLNHDSEAGLPAVQSNAGMETVTFGNDTMVNQDAPEPDAGIIIIGGAPDPGASSPDDAGMETVTFGNDIMVNQDAPEPDAGIIIVDGAPDPGASSPDDAGMETVTFGNDTMVNQDAPEPDAGIIIIDGEPDEPGIGDARTPSVNR